MKNATTSLIMIVSAMLLLCPAKAYSQSFCRLQGIISPTMDYFKDLDRYNDDRNFDPRAAYDRWKANVEKCLASNIGKRIATEPSSNLTAQMIRGFELTEASGNLGMSTAYPYAILIAKFSGPSQTVGYICRDGEGMPMYVGKTEISGGEARIVLRIHTDGSSDACIARAIAIGNIDSISIMPEEEFKAHELFCFGPSYNVKGFAKVTLGGDVRESPSSVPGLYDTKKLNVVTEEDEGWEQTTYEMVYSWKGKKIASAFYIPENGEIYCIEIYTTDIFFLPRIDPYAGAVPCHIGSDVATLFFDGRAKGIVQENEYYVNVPRIKCGVAWFEGFDLKAEMPDGSTFGMRDVAKQEKTMSLRLYF